MNFDALAKQKVAGVDIWLLRDASLQLPPHCVYSVEHPSDLRCGYKPTVCIIFCSQCFFLLNLKIGFTLRPKQLQEVHMQVHKLLPRDWNSWRILVSG